MTETRSTLDSGQKGWEYVLKNRINLEFNAVA